MGRASFVLLAGLLMAGCAPSVPIQDPASVELPLPRAPITTGLVGGTWRVVEINGEPVRGGRPVTMGFSEDDAVNGQGPCNRYSGEALISTNEVIFAAVMATKMACADPANFQEAAFFDILDGVVDWRLIESNELLLLARSGRIKARR
jgi:heat shock protein HslJ